jgi:hypothetical protein
MVLHVLILKYEGIKYPRNPNALPIELICNNQFFGPLVIAFNSTSPPYSLCNFTLNTLKELSKQNECKSKYPFANLPVKDILPLNLSNGTQ